MFIETCRCGWTRARACSWRRSWRRPQTRRPCSCPRQAPRTRRIMPLRRQQLLVAAKVLLLLELPTPHAPLQLPQLFPCPACMKLTGPLLCGDHHPHAAQQWTSGAYSFAPCGISRTLAPSWAACAEGSLVARCCCCRPALPQRDRQRLGRGGGLQAAAGRSGRPARRRPRRGALFQMTTSSK